jgi:hypothetical protein
MNLPLDLPKDVIILIYQFNVNHRLKMKIILNELLSKYNQSIINENRYNKCIKKNY